MRRPNIVALLALGVLAVLAVFSQADALQSTRAFKEVVLTVVITPSPAPVGFLYRAAPPETSARQVAFGDSAWDVAPGGGTLLAQLVPVQPTPVPVQFVAKPDPSALYLRVIPHTPELDVPYGTTVFPCAFEIYTFFDKATYALNDWGYGTVKTGSNGGTYPIENLPTASYLSWAVPDFSPKFTTYWNSGAPGERVWSGAMNQAQQHCIDLTVVVPNAQPAGTYTATIQYNLLVN